MSRLILPGLGCIVLWSLFGWLDYGLITKHNNDFCLKWSRDPWGQVSGIDWCERWRLQDIHEAVILACGGPLSLPVSFLAASSEPSLVLEYTHLPNAYPGKGAQR